MEDAEEGSSQRTAELPAGPIAEPGPADDTRPEGYPTLRGPPGVGDVLGDRYLLVAELGGGAMGQVFVAEHLAIGMHVAIKLLKPELCRNPVFRQRFSHEAHAVAAVVHPNVARFLDVVIGDPTFLVMEYVRGFTLAEVLQAEQQLEVPRAVAIAARLAWGLDAAHAAGVVHRDLKPANVIVAPDRERGETPKVIDFGLAKLAAATANAQLTRTGQLVGTPHYMAPEQIAGREVDARADVYALGCLLYEMIAGHTPFAGAPDDVQVLYRQVHEIPQPLRRRVPEVPAALDEAVSRALAKDPRARFPNIAAFARALEATLAPRRLSVPSAAAAHLAARPRLTAMLVALCALALAGTSVLLWQLARARIGAGAGHGLLVITTRPAGAQIELDGTLLRETTPTAVRDIAPGRHTLRVRRGDHVDLERPVTLAPGERAVLELSLPPTNHRLEIRTVPDDATVFLDGRLVVGATPTSTLVSDEDFHELRIEKTGYETLVRALTPEDRGVGSLLLQLAPEQKPRGTLLVDSGGPAEVWLDGIDTGFLTPTIGLHVSAGQHTIELRDSTGGRSTPTDVTVRQGETLRLLLPFHPGREGGVQKGDREP